MKVKTVLWFFILLTLAIIIGLGIAHASTGSIFLPARLLPRPPAVSYTNRRTGPLDVAKVFGRAVGCFDTTDDLIKDVADQASDADLDPKLLAAMVAVESGCNNFAVSNRGAIGLTQVVPKVWKDKYDFTDQYNLFNEHDNLKVGSMILGDLAHEYGVAEGLTRYQGLGTGPGYDPSYTQKILTLAGR